VRGTIPVLAALFIKQNYSRFLLQYNCCRNLGKGEEYVEFELGSTMVRLSAVFISIPPMPRGPLSVRTLRLDSIAGGEWRAVTPILVVENRSGWQRLDLPKPVDVQRVRVVCLSNQASRVLDRTTTAPPEFDLSYGAVGFYSIKFA
jgi:hypothetical protein